MTTYEEIYKSIHQRPELSMRESRNAHSIAAKLIAIGFDEILRGIGGHEVVGILRNGEGPTIMLRADMDALPLKELTGLPYASSVEQEYMHGKTRPVMHACGHDVHITCLLAACDLLFRATSSWAGTLIALFQPGEQNGAGARAMIRDGLLSKIPRPDVLLGQHVVPTKAGSVQIREGPVLSSCDCFDVRMIGKGGHGSEPQSTIDPILAACSVVMRLQGVVSREVDPAKFAVVTCAYFHAGHAVNIVPEFVDLKIDVRTYDPEVRKAVVAAVKRIVKAESMASGLPREPTITQTDDIPSIVNDSEVVRKLNDVFRAHFPDRVQEMDRDTASDDFSILAVEQGITCAYWNIGWTDPSIWDDAEKRGTLLELPTNHSAYFATSIQPTLKTGTDAIALAALAFLRQNGTDT